MAAMLRRRIAPALALLASALAAGSVAAGEQVAKAEVATDPPWLLLAGIAVAGTLAVGGLAALWARKLERAGPV
jgi:hypothetical protein